MAWPPIVYPEFNLEPDARPTPPMAELPPEPEPEPVLTGCFLRCYCCGAFLEAMHPDSIDRRTYSGLAGTYVLSFCGICSRYNLKPL